MKKRKWNKPINVNVKEIVKSIELNNTGLVSRLNWNRMELTCNNAGVIFLGEFDV